MAGEATRRLACRGGLAGLCALAATSAGAQQLEPVGACRDSVPNGAYELLTADGSLRAVGAFAQGRKTGTFVFWTGDGARVAVVPYNDDVWSGTIAAWYTVSGSGRELRPRSEAPYVDGKLQGVKRAWYRSGVPSLEARYEHGMLVDARGWTEAGAPLEDAGARAQAASVLAADEALYAALDVLVRDHLPHCE
ncbi:MAG: toxin-antitoxin system YwqK family antitoxin [Casimicrobiaceae bacterium]